MVEDHSAQRVTILIGETDRYHSRALYQALVTMLHAEGVAGATATRGILGYGATGRTHSAHLLDVAEDLPVAVVFVDSAEVVERVLPRVIEMVGSGLVTVEDVRAIAVRSQ
jgi:PII-like signaling protein